MKDCFPKLLKSTVVLQEGKKFLFLVPEKPDWIVGNENIAILLSLCNGKNSLSDIREIIAKHPFASEGEAVLDKLVQSKFFEKSIKRRKTSRYLLSSLHLNMTNKCNLKCVYCYAVDRKNNDNNLSLNDYYKIIEDAIEINKNVQITFTGGEPLLNKNTIKLGEYCKSKNIETFLLTNGVPITKSNVEKIAKTFDFIRISVDGYTEKTHEKHRGEGSYKKTMQAISLLEDKGKVPSIAMTVTNWNAHEIQEMSLRYGGRLTFQPLYKVGRAKENNIYIDGISYYNALKNATNVEPYAKMGEKLLSLKNYGCTKCAIGDREISISPSGDVYPCHMLHVDEFLAGNVREQSFKDIYYSSKVLKSIRLLSVNNREDCKDCPVRLLCGGGCCARAYLTTGSLNSADIFCDYELSAFKEGLLSRVSFEGDSHED